MPNFRKAHDQVITIEANVRPHVCQRCGEYEYCTIFYDSQIQGWFEDIDGNEICENCYPKDWLLGKYHQNFNRIWAILWRLRRLFSEFA